MQRQAWEACARDASALGTGLGCSDAGFAPPAAATEKECKTTPGSAFMATISCGSHFLEHPSIALKGPPSSCTSGHKSSSGRRKGEMKGRTGQGVGRLGGVMPWGGGWDAAI